MSRVILSNKQKSYIINLDILVSKVKMALTSNSIKGVHVLLAISVHWGLHLLEFFSFFWTDFPEHIVQLWLHLFVGNLGLRVPLYHFHFNIWVLAELFLLFLTTLVDFFYLKHVFLVNLFSFVLVELYDVLLWLILILDNEIAFFLFLMKGVGLAL